jgi:lysozyme family protein
MIQDNFSFSFDKMIQNEGGFILHKNKGDRGGWTYAGIAENFWPNWSGWPKVKSGNVDKSDLVEMVKIFYKKNFWDVSKLDQVKDPIIAYNIFDFGINAGARTSAKLAQIAVEAAPDGIIGNKTLAKINGFETEKFEMVFALAKVARYIEIVDKNRSQERFLRGWIKRTLNVLAE